VTAGDRRISFTSLFREELEMAVAYKQPLHLAIKQQRGVINDIHKQVLAVDKSPPKRPS
jgi:hypothetical protein